MSLHDLLSSPDPLLGLLAENQEELKRSSEHSDCGCGILPQLFGDTDHLGSTLPLIPDPEAGRLSHSDPAPAHIVMIVRSTDWLTE